MKHLVTVVDVETTGFSHIDDEVVELGLVMFEFDSETASVRVVAEYSGLRDPQRPVPLGATQAHGLCWDDLRGHSLDSAAVRRILGATQLLIAHNARFDRGFVCRLFPEANRIPWACSMNGIAWRNKGFPSKGLQELLRAHGIGEGAAHRALDDARNTLLLLSQRQSGGETYLAELLKCS